MTIGIAWIYQKNILLHYISTPYTFMSWKTENYAMTTTILLCICLESRVTCSVSYYILLTCNVFEHYEDEKKRSVHGTLNANHLATRCRRRHRPVASTYIIYNMRLDLTFSTSLERRFKKAHETHYISSHTTNNCSRLRHIGCASYQNNMALHVYIQWTLYYYMKAQQKADDYPFISDPNAPV